ncbi:MAG: aminopeptidase [Nitrospirota bacterium]|jgi:leucyl aminopeptidase (aminopeptidase T)
MVATDALRAIFRVNLGVKKDERVLVFTDKPSRKERLSPEDVLRRERLRDIALLAEETGRGFTKKIRFCEFPSTGSHGAEPPAELWESAFGSAAVKALREAKVLSPILRKKARPRQMEEAERILRRRKRSAVSAVVALSFYSTSHTAFRRLLTTACGGRYASMPIFEAPMLEGAMNVDWKALARRTGAVAGAVNSFDTVRVTTPNGTDITLSKKTRQAHADTGILTKPGSFGNLPAGEVYLAPLEGTARGTLVLEWAPTRELSSPVRLTIKEGLVTSVQGNEEFALELERKLSERPENRNLAELGIGTNDRATRPDNILESEKILGTVHFALGDSSSFGGRVHTPFHQDFVFFLPTVVLSDGDGKRLTLMKDGKLNRRALKLK